MMSMSCILYCVTGHAELSTNCVWGRGEPNFLKYRAVQTSRFFGR